MLIRHLIHCAAALAIAVAAALPAGSSARAADEAFHKWLDSLWPDVQRLGVSRKTFTSATHQLEPDLTLPDLDIPGRKTPPPAQAEFVQTPADYVRESTIARLAEQEARRRSPCDTRCHRAEARRSGQRAAGDLGPRDRLRRLSAAQERNHGAGDASLLRPAQGHVPPGAAVRFQDAGGGPRQARRHA